MSDDRTVRSLRNNNPGNLNSGTPWRGLMPRERMTPEQKAEPRFAVFQSPAYGFRALCKVLLTYQHAHGLSTLHGIVSRWAPPADGNDTAAYIARVCAMTGKAEYQHLDLADADMLRTLAKAIATVEAGGWPWLDDDLQAGVKLALA